MKYFLCLIVFFCFQTIEAQVNLSNGLQGYWNFNGNANDISGNNNHGIVLGATLCPDKNGNPNSAYLFDGVNDCIRVPNSPSINFPNNTFTYYALLRVKGFYSGPCHGNMVIDKGNTDYIAGSYSLRFSDGYSLNFQNCSSPVTVTQQNYYAQFNTISFANGAYLPYIDTSLWDCVIVTCDGSFIKLFLNGVQKQNFPVTMPLGVNNHDMFFGRKNSAQYPYWLNGIVDEIRIWNRALNTQEIDALCNCSFTLNASPNNPTICAGQSINLNVSGANTYSWSPSTGLSNPNIANPIAGPLSTTTYTVTGTSANGCTATSIVTVNVNNNPILSFQPQNPSVCLGDSIPLTASGANTYSWSPATGLSNPNIANPVASPSVTTTYTVTGTSANGCTATSIVTVNVNNNPILSFQPQNPSVCLGDSIPLTASGTNTYSWSPATGLSNPNIANPVASPSVTTTYTVTGTIGGSCSATGIITVTVNANPNLSFQPLNPVICSGQSVPLTASGANTYSWSPATGLSNSNIANPIAGPLSTTTYTITGTNAAGCSATSTLTVNVSDNPTLNVSPTNPSLCIGQSVLLSASGAANYSWSPTSGLSNSTSANPIANPTGTTTYTITGTNAFGCSATTTLTIAVLPLPNINIQSSTNMMCKGDTTVLTTSGASSYTWQPAMYVFPPNGNPVKISPPQNTTFTVQGTDANGCVGNATYSLEIKETISLTTNKTHDIACGLTETQLWVSGADQYVWSPSNGLNNPFSSSPIVRIDTTTTFYVTGSVGPCKTTDSITVYVFKNNAEDLFIPNAFSPNADGVNDCFKPIHRADFKHYFFTIYNRFGNRVFASYNPDQCWDGKQQNHEAQVDTYFYYLQAETNCGPIFLKGDVLLMR